MLLEDLADLEQVTSIGQRVLAAFKDPVRTMGGSIAVSASIGIHVAADDDDYDSLLQLADRAMYDAKRIGHGGIRFSPSSLRTLGPGKSLD